MNYAKKKKAYIFYYSIFALFFLFNPLIELSKKAFRKLHKSDSEVYKRPAMLFMSDSQNRETKAILNLFNGLFFTALCNDWWNWFAINIPFDLLGKTELIGDIDIIVSIPKNKPPIANSESIYRAFEIKSTILYKNSLPKSLKSGKRKNEKVLSQLKKLYKFGCQQIFLLELCLLERGFSDNHTFPTKEVESKVETLGKLLYENNFGYVLMADEPSTEMNEKRGGRLHFPLNILPAKENEIKQPFTDIVKHIDNFFKMNINTCSGMSIITFCRLCTKLVIINPKVEFICPHCKKSLFQ